MFVVSAEWEMEALEGMVWTEEMCLVWLEEGERG